MDRESKEKRQGSRGTLQVSARCRLKNRQRKCYMTNVPFNRGAKDINHALGIRFTDLTEKQQKAIISFIRQYLADMRQNKGGHLAGT
jgi:hypothetical protein